MDELVLMAPVQIKLKPHLGNIYDWSIIDFYSKALKLKGKKVFTPLIWNTLGYHITKYVKESGLKINKQDINQMVSKCIEEQRKYLKLFDITFDSSFRDDESTLDLERLIKDYFNNSLFKSEYKGNYCPSCERVLNNDPNIKYCKRCNVQVEKKQLRDYFIKVSKDELLKKCSDLSFYPLSLEKRLKNVINSFPKEYDLLLTKDRNYTAIINFNNEKLSLDPRYATILMIPFLCNSLGEDNTNITLIQGDIVKKLDYYLLAYSKDILPDKIVSHGILLNDENKKLRWGFDSENKAFINIKNKFSPRIIKAFLLSNNIDKDISLSEQRLIGVKRFKNKIDNVLYYLKINLSEDNFLRFNIEEESKYFLDLVNNFEFRKAFTYFRNLVYNVSRDYCIKLKDLNKASDVNLYNFLNDIDSLYFGGSDIWSLDLSIKD